MDFSERRQVLILGDSPVSVQPFNERHLKLLHSDINQAHIHFDDSRAVIVADFESKFGLIQECFRRVFPTAEDHGLLPLVLVHSLQDHTQVSALREKDHKASRAQIVLFADLPQASELVARHLPGPPMGKVKIEPSHLLSSPDDRLLLQRAFADCERIYLEPLLGGKASIGVYRTHAWIKQSQVGPRPLPFFVKIASREAIAQEEEKYQYYADHYIPFNLRPNLDRSRCVHTRDRAVLVGNFVDDALPLRKSLRSGHGVGALFSLFETTLRGFRLQPFYSGNSPTPGVIQQFVDGRIRSTELSQNIIDKASSFGLGVSPKDMHAHICQMAASLKCWVAPYHGDLHTGNVMIRGGDAIVIDFSSTENGPLTADPAALEVSLMFGTDEDDKPDMFGEWQKFIDKMYVGAISNLHPPVFDDAIPGTFSWLGRSMRELRHVLLGCGCECIEANLVLAAYLMRFARLSFEELPSDDLKELAAARHAYALVIAQRLTSSLSAGKSL